MPLPFQLAKSSNFVGKFTVHWIIGCHLGGHDAAEFFEGSDGKGFIVRH